MADEEGFGMMFPLDVVFFNSFAEKPAFFSEEVFAEMLWFVTINNPTKGRGNAVDFISIPHLAMSDYAIVHCLDPSSHVDSKKALSYASQT